MDVFNQPLLDEQDETQGLSRINATEKRRESICYTSAMEESSGRLGFLVLVISPVSGKEI